MKKKTKAKAEEARAGELFKLVNGFTPSDDFMTRAKKFHTGWLRLARYVLALERKKK